MSDLPYAEIPPVPPVVAAGTVLARLVDGLGFRFRYATEGLREEEFDFRACESHMTIGELIEHVYKLVAWTDTNFGGEALPDLAEPSTPAQFREAMLRRAANLSARLQGMSDADLAAIKIKRGEEVFPFWFLINGPLADALTHVGQIAGWRRMNGHPVPKHGVFLGKKG